MKTIIKILLAPFIFVFIIFFVGQVVFSKDMAPLKFEMDTTLNSGMRSFRVSPVSVDYSISHYPSKQDSVLCKSYSKLITAGPTKKNHSGYYSLACSLWQLGRLKDAESMFLTILASNQSYYTGTYYHSSDIPGDTTISTFGYGSCTSNYKNEACRYLAKIYIEENKFDQALKYIRYADEKYLVEQNCGTGYMWYRSEIEGLYGLAFEGAGMYDSILSRFLPQYSIYSNRIVTTAIKKVYSQAEINDYLKLAENSIACVVDTFQSSSAVVENFGKSNESTKYTSGRATMTLFGRKIALPAPQLDNGTKATREIFVKEFKESEFYLTLIDNG